MTTDSSLDGVVNTRNASRVTAQGDISLSPASAPGEILGLDDRIFVTTDKGLEPVSRDRTGVRSPGEVLSQSIKSGCEVHAVFLRQPDHASPNGIFERGTFANLKQPDPRWKRAGKEWWKTVWKSKP